MRRRKNNDKRVLKPRHNRPPANKMKRRRRPYNSNNANKASKRTMLFIIIALISFVVGAGIGISMAIGGVSDDEGAEESFDNVTVEMTSNLNNTTVIDYYDSPKEIDYNNPEDIVQYNLTNNSISY